jgi:putative tryptophan/tyrosine transport system substrate-binding protein
MRRREFIGLAGAAAAWPLMAQAQEAGRTYRLGFLAGGQRDQPNVAAMFESLRRSGFIEGQNLIVDWRAFERQPDRAPELAAELVKAKPDVLYATGEIGIKTLLRATTTIPIVGLTQDMVGSGFATSLAHPTGNVTGVSVLATELDGKRQEMLCDALPGLKHMAALVDTNYAAESRLLGLRDAMRARGGELSVYRVAKREEIGPAIDSAKAAGAEALNVLSSPILYGNRQIIIGRAAELRLPAIYPFPEEAAEGGFAAYGPSIVALWRDVVASMLVKLLRGVKPVDIPVEQPTNFELAINLKTASALGLTLPSTLLARADVVIE